MPSAVENIFQNFMSDPNFELGKPESERRENAWRLAWDRFHQTQRNNVALSMAKEELQKESVGTMGPDSGASKYPFKIGGPTTIENTKKFGQKRINLHRDPNRTWRTRPETAAEMTTDKEGLEKIFPVAAAKKLFSKPPKTLEELENERMRRNFGYTKKGEVPLNKQEQFRAYLEKHLTDTLEEEPAEYSPDENLLGADADSEMMSNTAITIDTIIDALTQLRDNISQHELDEMTGQERDGLELFSLEKHARKQPHYHPYSETGPGIDVESYRKPKSLIPKKKKFLYMPGQKPYLDKHYTGAKHEHLESGQWVRPGMKTVPGKTWGGKVLAKKDFKDLDFKDQDAVKAEAEMFAQGKLKKPVAKQIDSRGKSGTFNIQGAASGNKPLEKHEDFAMHGHAGLSGKKYPFMSHIIPPVKTKTEPVKKDTSSISEITGVQKDKKIGNVFAISTRAAQRLGFRDFSEGSPGKEKRGEIAEALKRKEGIKKEAQKTLYNVLSNRKYAASDSTPITTGVTSPQLRVE